MEPDIGHPRRGVLLLAPLSSILARPVRVRVVVPLGLTAMGGGRFILAQVNTTSGYALIAGAGAVLAALALPNRNAAPTAEPVTTPDTDTGDVRRLPVPA